MIRLPEAIYVATAPVNLHLSFDRLGGIVREVLRRELYLRASHVMRIIEPKLVANSASCWLRAF